MSKSLAIAALAASRFALASTAKAETDPMTVVQTSGSVVATYTFSIAKDVPASVSDVTCQLTINVVGADFYAETSTTSVKRSGSSAICTVEIDYSWSLAKASADNLTFQGSATALDGAGAGRTTQFTFPFIKVPANGATTTLRHTGGL